LKKIWVVDGEYYHKGKSKLKRILGTYGFQYEWKERPKYVWRRDKERWVEGEFDREESLDGEVTRRAARFVYFGPENPEMFDLIDDWASGHETKWRLGVEKDAIGEVKKDWEMAIKVRSGIAPDCWLRLMGAEMEEKLKELEADLLVEDEIDICDYMYMGV